MPTIWVINDRKIFEMFILFLLKQIGSLGGLCKESDGNGQSLVI